MRIRIYYYRHGRYVLWESADTMEIAMLDFDYLHRNGYMPYMEKEFA